MIGSKSNQNPDRRVGVHHDPRRAGVLLSAWAAVLCSCAAAPPAPAENPSPSPDQTPQAQPPPPLTVRENPQTPWTPLDGRMSDDLRRRHLPPRAEWRVLFDEGFDSASSHEIPSWTLRGGMETAPFTLRDQTGVELRARGAASDMGILERALPPAPLAGRNVRLDLRLACTSQPQVDALQGVRLSVEARDLAGRQHTRTLPLRTGISPGWETESFYLRFDPALGAVTLRIEVTRPEARIAVDRIRLLALPDTARGQGSGRTLPGPVNLIVDGDFETLQPRFFTSGTRRLPGGEVVTTPLLWEFVEDGLVGDSALWLMQDDETCRVGFGSLDLTRTSRPGESRLIWHLSLHARSSSPAVIQATLRDRWKTLGRHEFHTSSVWSRLSCSFLIEPESFIDRAELARAELLLDFAPQTPGTRIEHWLDGVALTHIPMGSSRKEYARSGAYEIGLSGPPAPSFDLAGLIDVSQTVKCAVRVLADARVPMTPPTTRSAAENPHSLPPSPSPQLALDVVDASDRRVWTRTASIEVDEHGIHGDELTISLPRGYYRVLATIWSDEPAASELLAHTQLPLAVIDKNDAIPRNGRYGLTASEGAVSLHTTHLGAGWIRVDLTSRQARTDQGRWDFAFWNQLMTRAAMGRIDVIVGLTLPRTPSHHVDFIRAWLSDPSNAPWAMVVSPPNVAADPAAEYFDQLSRIANALRNLGRQVELVRDLSATGLEATTVADIGHLIAWPTVGFSCAATHLPEQTEPLLEAIAGSAGGGADAEQIWDLRVPARLSEPSAWNDLPLSSLEPPQLQPVIQLHAPPAPDLSASRLVRGLLIRGLAGASRVCSAARALEPVRSAHQPADLRLHTLQLAPRPALVALDWMTSLLNHAELRRWIDHPGGSRLLVYAHDDGRRIVAMWRPYGLSPTPVAFPALPESATLYDVMGRKVELQRQDDRVVIGLNELVQYLVLPGEDADALENLLSQTRIAAAALASPPVTQNLP